MTPEFVLWLTASTGHTPRDPALFERALTHSSRGGPDYERLEFLGDRVLGLTIAEWLYDMFPDEPEGKLSGRLNALVTRETCAEVGRATGLRHHLRLGKQARDDGAADSDNVVGDVVEALIGALHLDGGAEVARNFVRAAWAPYLDTRTAPPRHPKAALQEWAAAHGRPAPAYSVVHRAGPQHAPRFTVAVAVARAGEASAEAGTKHAAETAAAAALLERLA